jgi:hypothetical protein
VITQGPPCFSISFAQGSDLYERVRLLISSHILAQFDERILPLLPQLSITPSSSAPISSTSSPGLSGGKARGRGPFVDEALTSERKLKGQAFLEVVEAVWENHKGAMQKVSSVLKYMVSPWLVFSSLLSSSVALQLAHFGFNSKTTLCITLLSNMCRIRRIVITDSSISKPTSSA